MKPAQKIHRVWTGCFAAMSATPGFRRLLNAQITREHYQSIMTQIYYHARENPQIQTLATVYFRGSQRAQIKRFFQHATSEIGHDQLALNDLETLGVDTSAIPGGRPLPATTALLAFAFYQIQHFNPVGYLGYLYHLEFMPTTSGAQYMAALEKIGVPQAAMSFIRDHTVVDVGHNKLMRSYIEHLIQTEDDLDSVLYCLAVTATLYGNMISEAVEEADLRLDRAGLRADCLT